MDILTYVFIEELQQFAEDQGKQIGTDFLSQLNSHNEHLIGLDLNTSDLSRVLLETGKKGVLVSTGTIVNREDFLKVKVGFGCSHAYENCGCLVTGFLKPSATK